MSSLRFLLLVAPASCWILTAQDLYGTSLEQIREQLRGRPNQLNPQVQLGSIWSLPVEGVTDPSWGLGGGITWAWDPELCEPLMKRFSESLAWFALVTCADAKAAVDRAFARWAGNNRLIHFADVSEECARMTDAERASASSVPPGSNLRSHGGCGLAEIHVSFLQGEDIVPDVIQVAVALPYTANVAKYDPTANIGCAPCGTPNMTMKFTNGERPYMLRIPDYFSSNTDGSRDYDAAPFFATYGGTLKFDVSDRNCWYLDSRFCSGFHRFKQTFGGPEAGRTAITSMCWGISLLSAIMLICTRTGFIRFCRHRKFRTIDRDGDGHLDMHERMLFVLEEMSTWNPLVLAFFWMMMISPPLVLYYIFLPCWNCSDFEAAALHEIGHLLGLGHPDAVPEGLHAQLHLLDAGPPMGNDTYNAWLAGGGKVNHTNCKSLWDDTYHGVPPQMMGTEEVYIGSGGYMTRHSVMAKFTQHNPTACLTDDDVNALAMMSPDCEPQAHSVNVCHKVTHNIGLVRMMIYVALPLFVSLCIILCLSGIAATYLNNELEDARLHAEKLDLEMQQMKKDAKRELGHSIYGEPITRTTTGSKVSRRVRNKSMHAAVAQGAAASAHEAETLPEAMRERLKEKAHMSRAAAVLLSKRSTTHTEEFTFDEGPLGVVVHQLKTNATGGRITAVDKGSQAEALHVHKGGILLKVNGMQVTDGKGTQAIAEATRPVTLTLQYHGPGAVKKAKHTKERRLSGQRVSSRQSEIRRASTGGSPPGSPQQEATAGVSPPSSPKRQGSDMLDAALKAHRLSTAKNAQVARRLSSACPSEVTVRVQSGDGAGLGLA